MTTSSYTDNQLKHLNHPFYQEVAQFADETEKEQILKGAEKYEEPFTPDSWACDALASHAMQEFRDGQVYVTGMRDRMRKQEAKIAELEYEIQAWKTLTKLQSPFIDPKEVTHP